MVRVGAAVAAGFDASLQDGPKHDWLPLENRRGHSTELVGYDVERGARLGRFGGTACFADAVDHVARSPASLERRDMVILFAGSMDRRWHRPLAGGCSVAVFTEGASVWG